MIEPGKVKSVAGFFEDKISLSIPSYQRPYAWQEAQVNDLISDINNAKGDEHYLGAVYVISKPNKDYSVNLDIVDGQQRTTTLSIFALALMRVLEKTYANLKNHVDLEDDKYQKYNYCKDYINKLKHIIFSKLDEDKIKLKLGANDNEAWSWLVKSTKGDFKEINKGEFKFKTRSQERVVNSYNIIVKEIIRIYPCILNEDKLHIDIKFSWENLDLFVETFLLKLKIITLTLTETKGTSVFKFFSLINNRGKKLSWLDDIKCVLLQSVYEWTNNGNDDYNEIIRLWGEMMVTADESIDNYFLTYWNAHYKWSTKKAIEKRFITEFIDNDMTQNSKIEKIKKLLNSMINNYDHYKTIMKADLNPKFNQNIKNELNYIKEYSVVHPLILKALINKVNNNDLYKLARRARIIAWSVIGLQGKKSSTVEKYIKYDKINKYLELHNGKVAFDTIDDDFKKELNKTTFFENGYLNKNMARNTLMNSTNPELNHHIIVELLNVNKNKDELISSYNRKTWDKEHIIPTKWKDNKDWKIIIDSYLKSNSMLESDFNTNVNRLGNLIPLSENINRSIKNKFIDIKIEEYGKSNAEHIKTLLKEISTKNILNDINIRNEKLADQIVKSPIFDFNLPQ